MLRDFVDGRYRVEQEVGRGGMGIVLRAFDTRLNRAVAIKILPPDATHDPDRLRRLAAEARAASALNHTGIATVYDFVEQGADSFIVYEYIDGRTLRNSLARDRFSTDDVLGVGIQLADALVAAHTRGITHRDLKPENIMLVPDDHFRWRVKILDFGLAKQRPELLSAGTESGAETVSVATVPGLLVGTITYMAPEQLESRPTDERTDIYALGLVLYEMATGANPFMGRTLPSTVANILKQEPQPLGQQSARDRSGFILFLVQLACILFITILLSFLLYTLALDPSALPHEVQRLAPWIRGLTLALVLVTWAMCAVAVGSQPVLATLLALCSTAGGLKYTVFKTAIDRGIFPKQ
jgi:serine/threonine protein kinase